MKITAKSTATPLRPQCQEVVRLRGLRGTLQGRRRAAPVARGTTYDIANQPIDYLPYDPDYHDVNRVMGSDQKKPLVTLEEVRRRRSASTSLYDPNVFFDDDDLREGGRRW